jgi:hypothetical protein
MLGLDAQTFVAARILLVERLETGLLRRPKFFNIVPGECVGP